MRRSIENLSNLLQRNNTWCCHFGHHDGDVIFIFMPIENGVHDTYDRTIDGMETNYDGQVWCRTRKQQTFIMNSGCLTRGPHALAISNALTILVSICPEMIELAIIPSGLTLHPLDLLWTKDHHMGLGFNARLVIPFSFVSLFVMQRLHTLILHHLIHPMYVSI